MGNLIDKLSGGPEKRSDGLFYALEAQIWQGTEAEYSESDYRALRRQSLHPYYTKSVEATQQDNDNKLIPAESADRSEYDSGSSMNSRASDSVTAMKRKRRLETIAIDGRERDSADIAHLLPHATSCSRLYAPLIEGAVGVDFGMEPPARKKLKRQILLHGLYAQNDENNNLHRVPGTGAKHCRTNMARVVAQRKYLDSNPSILILPIMTLKQVLEYERGRYSVLVVAARPSVYEETVLTKRYDLCTLDDIELATRTLSSFVKGTAFVLENETSESDIDNIKNSKERRAIKQTKAALEEKKVVKIPDLVAHPEFRKLRVPNCISILQQKTRTRRVILFSCF